MPVAPELGRAFAAACYRRTRVTDAELHAAVVALVEAMKVDRAPPERVVIALKLAIARYSGVTEIPSLATQCRDEASVQRAQTYERAFGWCVHAYFRLDEAGMRLGAPGAE